MDAAVSHAQAEECRTRLDILRSRWVPGVVVECAAQEDDDGVDGGGGGAAIGHRHLISVRPSRDGERQEAVRRASRLQWVRDLHFVCMCVCASNDCLNRTLSPQLFLTHPVVGVAGAGCCFFPPVRLGSNAVQGGIRAPCGVAGKHPQHLRPALFVADGAGRRLRARDVLLEFDVAGIFVVCSKYRTVH